MQLSLLTGRPDINKWDVRYLNLAKEVSSWSKDPSAKVGVVAVRDRRILSTGYNGFPKSIADTVERLNDRNLKYKYVIHAEQNMIYNATAHGVNLNGCSVYVYGLPACVECTKALIQTGSSRIIGAVPMEFNARWAESFEHSKELMIEAGVAFDLYNVGDL